MQSLSTFLQALATLAWPVFAFTIFYWYREEIRDILKRIKRGKVFGQEIELDESLNLLHESTADVQAEVAAMKQPSMSEKTEADVVSDESIKQKILEEAVTSPKAALITLAAELERLTQELLATTGRLNGRRYVPLKQAISELHKAYGLAAHVPSSLNHFLDVRNRIIHKGEGSNGDILRAIDSGMALLRALQAMPREIYIVREPKVDVFYDPALKNKMEGIHGVMIEVQSPSGVSKDLHVFPSTRNDYIKGKKVSWEWNIEKTVNAAWYLDPITGQAEGAWLHSSEFIGRHLDEL